MAGESDSLTQNLTIALKVLVETLSKRQAQYALIGGLAAGLRGRFRFADDIEFIVSVTQFQLPGLLEELVARGFR